MVKKSGGWPRKNLVATFGLRFTTLIPHRYFKINLHGSIMEGFATQGSTRCKHFTNKIFGRQIGQGKLGYWSSIRPVEILNYDQ